ncbi:Ir51b [Drosophila busckii]|uniref:Ir51b n=1 Tax=Drosophila busckii TaxID=30019 RepID=A0A0M4EEY5_DROBS|nr:uncharacterized protein LOC108594961 [Drosophila busckii]ALC42727.1 Ir51b [Drosophila busckii]
MQRATLLLLLASSYSLAAATPAAFNMSFVQSIVERVAHEQSWKHTPVFTNGLVQLEQVQHLLQWLQQNLSVASYIFTGTTPLISDQRGLRLRINTDALSLLFCQGPEELIWQHMDHQLRKLHNTRLIVVLTGQRLALQQIFERLWQLQFLQVLVLHEQRLYGYTPYPKVSYFELQQQQQQKPLFAGRTHNFNGYVVSTPAENDVPRVFIVPDAQRPGEQLVRGFGYHIMAEFLQRHNAQLNISNAGLVQNNSSVNMSRINQLIGAQKLEITLHPYIGIEPEYGVRSYALTIAKNCLIVPVRNEIPRYMYLLSPLHWRAWLLLLGSVCYMSVALYWLSPAASGSAGYCLLESLSLHLLLSTPVRIYKPSLRYALVALQLFVLGFVVTNCYNNQLSSALTATLVGEQVDSFEQLIAQQQRILVKQHEVSMVLEQVPPHMQEQVARLVVPSGPDEQMQALLSFNTSYSYPFTVERWEFFRLQQQYAQKPIYRYSSVCLGSPVIGFAMRKDSHFEVPFNHFIMNVQTTGLFSYWLASDFNDALNAGFVRLIDNVDNFKAFSLDTLRLAWIVLVGGWVFAAVAFICEHCVAWR